MRFHGAVLSAPAQEKTNGEADDHQDPSELARTMTEKMGVRKYDPVVRKHVEYKEGKIK